MPIASVAHEVLDLAGLVHRDLRVAGAGDSAPSNDGGAAVPAFNRSASS
jgi:hypothetical protein